MELTIVAAASLLSVGVGYAFVQRARRPRFLCWGLLCATLFALATRDLFRPRRQERPAARPSSPTSADGSRRRPPLLARLRSRVGGWFD